MQTKERFTQQLHDFLQSKDRKTVGGLLHTFEERGFAVLFLVLMAIPALPIPTGGFTYVLESIVIILALELILGKKRVWLPLSWYNKEIIPERHGGSMRAITVFIQTIERFSKPRLPEFFGHTVVIRIIGIVVLIFAVFAILAPPFSGLDTLPSLGIVLIALSMLLEDILLSIAGLLVGVTGILLVLLIGKLVLTIF